MNTGTIVVLAVVGGVGLVLMLAYNALVVRRNQVENAYGTVDVMLKKRFDLIPSLVATVKQYAAHEQDTLTRLTELRARAAQPQVTSDAKVGLDNMLTQALGKLMAVVENYPTLQASGGFQQLQRSLTEIEEQLSASRRAYNAAVTDYNNIVEMFPTSVLAAMFGHRRLQVFLAAEAERARPDVAAMFRG